MKPALKPLSEQVVVVTGASSGIGLATARMAARRGARVLLVARSGDALREIVRAIERDGGEADFAVADVGEREEVEAAARAAAERWGRIDTWVNNAGVAIYGKLSETPQREHERLFRTNYFGVVNGATAALPFLRESRGALVTVASVVSDIPTPVMGAYAASKHAVKGFIESLRMELVAEGAPVSVTLVKPSGMGTPIARHAANHTEGRPMVPPPVYAPALVARAILHAATHPRRTITVGGAGQAQALFGTHFPWALDRIAPLLIPVLARPGGEAREGAGNLWAPAGGGVERSDEQPGRSVSLYTEAALRPGIAVAAALGAAALGLAAGLAFGGRRDNGARAVPAAPASGPPLERMGST